jgi:hypothetical protein
MFNPDGRGKSHIIVVSSKVVVSPSTIVHYRIPLRSLYLFIVLLLWIALVKVLWPWTVEAATTLSYKGPNHCSTNHLLIISATAVFSFTNHHLSSVSNFSAPWFPQSMNRFPTLSGLSFTQLPFCTQQYLQQAKLVPPHAPDLNFISIERFKHTNSSLLKSHNE